MRDVAAQLLADPEMPLTIARVADAIGAAPMSLYRHFADREDLVSSVARHLMTDRRPPVDDAATWQERVRVWMRHVHAQAVRVPQLTQMVASGESPSWIADSAYLAGVLESAGFTDDQRLAEAVYWVAANTMGQAMLEASGPRSFPLEATTAAIALLDGASSARMRRILPHLAEGPPQRLDRVIEWTISALENDRQQPVRSRRTRRT